MLAKALLTTVILGTSTVAAAQPGTWTWRDRGDRYDRYDRDRDRDYERDHRYGRYDNRDWFPVAQNISFYSRSQKRTPDQQVVHIGAERGNISALRFEGTAGRTVISQVFVRFADGSGETYNVNSVLMPGESAVVRLSHYAPVKAIRVYTQLNYYGPARDMGTFSVLAS